MNEAERQRHLERQSRRNEMAKMPKCRCGNIARQDSELCGRCAERLEDQLQEQAKQNTLARLVEHAEDLFFVIEHIEDFKAFVAERKS